MRLALNAPFQMTPTEFQTELYLFKILLN